MAEDIQDLGDILRKLRDSSAVNGDGARPDEDYIYREEPEDVCPACGNRRWLAVEVPVGASRLRQGTAVPVPGRSLCR